MVRMSRLKLRMDLEDLGYNQTFEDSRIRLGYGNAPVARVITAFKDAYRVKNDSGEYLARVTGKYMYKAVSREEYPVVGDWVAISETDTEHAVILGILPRATLLKRTYSGKNTSLSKPEIQVIAANIDVAFIVEAVDRDYNVNRFIRYVALAIHGSVTPILVLNKVDLISPAELSVKCTELKKRLPDVTILTTSTTNGTSITELENTMERGHTYCFLGSSGVGKSSLINALLGQHTIQTESISSRTGRGKHTTTGRHLYILKQGGIVIDNPGIREVGIADAKKGIEILFKDISAETQQCKYTDCTHTHEPGCSIRASVVAGNIENEQYENYLSLKNEANYSELSTEEKRSIKRKFGKFINKAKKEHKAFWNE